MAFIDKLGKSYTSLATILLSTLLLFVFATITFSFYYKLKGIDLSDVNPRVYQSMISRDRESLHKVYPDKSDQQIDDLLMETWIRPYIYTPYAQFKERPFRGVYVNVSTNGYRYSANQATWPPRDNNFNIFMFGGSTTFGYGVADHETIASGIYRNLSATRQKKRIAIYNFGVGYYFSDQERIRYEQLLTSGYIPDLAIFLDGINEIYAQDGSPALTKLLEQVLERDAFNKTLPRMVKIFQTTITEAAKQFIQQSPASNLAALQSTPKSRIVENYLENMKIIHAVSEAYNVTPVLVWQPSPIYKYDLQYHPFKDPKVLASISPASSYESVKESMKHSPYRDNFLWLGDIQENVHAPLYVDHIHYTESFSRNIADHIAEFIEQTQTYRDMDL